MTTTPAAPSPVFTFDQDAHKYYLDGVEIPGVTTVLKTAGLSSVYDGFTDAALRGLHVHQACEWLDLNDLDWSTVYPQWVGYVKAYERFKDDTGFQPTLIEYQSWHRQFLYGGTLDRVGQLNGKSVLADIKTGQPEDWHALQTAAYSLLVDQVDERMAIYLKEDGTYRVEKHADAADVRVFLGALSVTHWKRAHAS